MHLRHRRNRGLHDRFWTQANLPARWRGGDEHGIAIHDVADPPYSGVSGSTSRTYRTWGPKRSSRLTSNSSDRYKLVAVTGVEPRSTTLTNSVTETGELAPLTSEETIEGYLPENQNVAQSLAAHADATDCVYFEGALTDRQGGVVRVEVREPGSVMYGLTHVLPGYTVAGIEPLVFTPDGAIERAIRDGELDREEWDAMSEQRQEEFVERRRERFRETNRIQQPVDRALRIELVLRP